MQVTSIIYPPGRVPGSYQPALDLTGVATTNLITGEIQTVIPNTNSPFEFLIPSYAPFFTTGFTAYRVNSDLTKTLLILGVDYYFAFPFIGGSRALGVALYAGISFTNTALAEPIYLVYQTLGGTWLIPPTTITEVLVEVTADPCGIAWEQYAEYPTQFPVITTPWNLEDTTSLSAVTTSLANLETTLGNVALAQNYTSETTHLASFTNPHNVTATQLGLGLVANLAPASNVDAMAITNTTQYITTAQVNYLITNLMTPASATVKGVIKLADGITQSEASSATLALTAATFSDYVVSQQNGLGVLLNQGQIIGSFSIVPTTFPRIWNGVSYPTLFALLTAVVNSVGLISVTYNANLGCFYFPQGTVVPNLTLT